MINFRILLLAIIILLPITQALSESGNYPSKVEVSLRKSGSNRAELEKAILYYVEKGDSQMLQAVYFLIENMDIHYGETYTIKDGTGTRLPFSEFEYPDINTASAAWDSIRQIKGHLNFQDSVSSDLQTIKANLLIDNINKAFSVWRSSKYKDISFEDFCEYILPYRVTVEPLCDWRHEYHERYQWLGDSLQSKSLERVLEYAAMDYNMWFKSNYGGKPVFEEEPSTRLSAKQLLFRKTAGCENIAALEVFSLRSQSIPVAYDLIPWWGTSMGGHFVNTAFDEQMHPIHFDVTYHIQINPTLAREPGKVLRLTYSKQPNILASRVEWREIPSSVLRTLNYKDVTDEWWETADVHASLFSDIPSERITYAYIYNWGRWRPVWWGETQSDSVIFSKMPQGVVILPVYYKNGDTVPAGHPVLNAYNHVLHLAPDTVDLHTVEIKQENGYLKFRPNKKYELFYWDREWKSLGVQTTAEDTQTLVFANVPRNSLLRLIPEYTAGKERPFIILKNGKRYWW